MPRLQKTLADYIAIAISPALIMVLVGSLVFFLASVFYQGAYPTRLNIILGLFVFASVLIGRISIEQGRAHAAPFALALAGATGFALFRFVEYSGAIPPSLSTFANLTLMGVIWWSADKLTYDCTVIDEDKRSSSEGLMQTIGFDDEPARGQAPKATDAKQDDQRQENSKQEDGKQSPGGNPASARETAGTTSRDEADKPRSWWDRKVERRGRPHAPGLWVVYFSLAALPIFGFGQGLIPASDVEMRRWVFWLFCAYLAAGLGLLISTSFLGLRRYLRQRQVEMPSSMAGWWLVTGSLLVLGLLVVTALLPRPAAEYAVSDLSLKATSPVKTPSNFAMGGEGTETKNSGRGTTESSQPPNENSPTADGQRNDSEQQSSKQQGDSSQQGNQSSENGEGNGGDQKSNNQSSSSQSDSSSQQNNSSNNQQGDQGNDQSSGNQQSDDSQSGGDQGDQQSNDDSQSGGNNQSDQQSGNQDSQTGQQSGNDDSNSDNKNDDQNSGSQQGGDQSQGGEGADDQNQSQNRDKQQGRDNERQNNSSNSSGGSGSGRVSENSEDPESSGQDEDENDGGSGEAEDDSGGSGSGSGSASEGEAASANDTPDVESQSWFDDVDWLTTGFKWLIYVVVAIVVLYVLLRHGKEILRGFREFLANIKAFLLRLFGGAPPKAKEAVAAKEVKPKEPPPRPFSSYADPFSSGMADKVPPQELVRYSFEAFEAWARDQGRPRGEEETPHEFAQDVAQSSRTVAKDARNLADLYDHAAYAPEGVTTEKAMTLSGLWKRLRGKRASSSSDGAITP